MIHEADTNTNSAVGRNHQLTAAGGPDVVRDTDTPLVLLVPADPTKALDHADGEIRDILAEGRFHQVGTLAQAGTAWGSCAPCA